MKNQEVNLMIALERPDVCSELTIVDQPWG